MDKRPTLTLKSHAFTPDFRALINNAAQAEGMTQADWVEMALRGQAKSSLSRVQASQSPTTPDNNEENVQVNCRVPERMRGTFLSLARKAKASVEIEQHLSAIACDNDASQVLSNILARLDAIELGQNKGSI